MSDPTETRSAHETVDREHQVQLGLLDSLRDAILADRPVETIDEVQAQVLDYTRIHFLSEELLMRLHADPEYDAHVAEHSDMLDTFDAFVALRADNRLGDAVAAVQKLRAAMLEHIGGRDKQLHAHLRTSGVGPASG